MLALNVLARDPLDVEAITVLEAANRIAKTSIPAQDEYADYFAALAQVFAKKPSPVSEQAQQLAFRTINNLVRRLITSNSDNVSSVSPVLRILFDQLRPSGFQVDGQPPVDFSSNQVRAAATLQDLYLASPSLVEESLKLDGFGNPNPEVRHASLLFLEACLRLCNGKFRPLTPAVTRMLNDSDPAVKQATTALLCSFFAKAPIHAKNDLAREIKHQQIENPDEILEKIGLRSASPPAPGPSNPVPSRRAATTGGTSPISLAPTGGAPLIHEITINPQYKMQTLNAEDVSSVAAFRSIVESLQPVFSGKELETNWEAREKAVNRLRSLIRGNIIDYPGDIVWALKFLAHDIKQAVYSLRTTLCSSALQLIKDSTQILKSYFDAVIDPYMQFLCEVVASTKKITSNLAYITCASLVLNTSMSTKIVNYTHNMVSNQLPSARTSAFKWYHIMFVCHSPDIRYILESTTTVDIVQNDIKKGLGDPQSPVREASRSVFWLFAALWPSRAESLGSSLDTQAKKQLLRTQPKELLDSYDHNFELHVNRRKPKQDPSRPAAPTSSSSTSGTSRSRPNSRAGTLSDTSRPVTASRGKSVTAGTVLTAKAHIPDIIRRVSRALNDPKPRADVVLHGTPANINSAPVDLGGLLAPNEHVAAALDAAAKLIDAMPQEPEETPGQMETVEHEPEKDIEVDYNGNERVSRNVSTPQAPSPEPTRSVSPDNPMEIDQGEGFNPGMLVQSLVESTRQAIADTIEERGSNIQFDPAKFDQHLQINNASDFKDALRSELGAIPTIDISIEDIASKTAKKMQPRFEEYIKLYPESKDAIMQAATVVEAAARKKEGQKGSKESPTSDSNDGASAVSGVQGTDDDDDVVMKGAVDAVAAQLEEDTEGTTSKLSSLEDLIDSDNIDTMTMGMNVLSYMLCGKKPPRESLSGLGTLSIPPPDLIGKALNYLFDRAMDNNPQVKELLEKFASADLVAITLSYVGHALVMYVAVHLLPAEALVLTVQVIQPLLNIGAIIDTLFEIANSDDITEAALLALGGLLTGFDKLPMNPILRDKAKAALEVIYRLGDLSSDVTAFLADWIGFDSDSDSDSDSDDDSDEEKIADKHARKFERHMAARTPSAVANAVALIALEKTEPEITASISKLRLEQTPSPPATQQDTQDPDSNQEPVAEQNMEDPIATGKAAIFAEPISSLHPVPISYLPGAQNNKAVRRNKVSNTSALETNQKPNEVDQIRAVFSPAPKSQGECLALFESLAHQLLTQTIRKQGLVQLISLARGSGNKNNTDSNALAFQLWHDLPQMQDRIARASLTYCERRKFKEEELSLSLILVRTLLENGGFTTSVDQVRLLETLCIVSEFDLPPSIEYAALPKTRDVLLDRNINTDYFIGNLINVFTTGSTPARLFALKTLREVVSKTKIYPSELQHTIKAAMTDNDVRIRKESYPILLNIHVQSESAARAITKQLSQGQQRLFEYYASSS